ncbi:MAG: nicotinamide-nucleotide amidohydrolase family protein [Lachnospiraceae bacterium]|nr:nicotinamide-nucleotide amidohydrolase family protein [Lachnospiraceae bacterium]
MSDDDNNKQKDGSADAAVRLVGIKADKVREELADILSAGNPSAEITDLHGEVCIRLHAVGDEEKNGKKVLKPVVKEIKSRLGQMIYSTDEDETLEDAVVGLLKENHFTIATAESCTAGLFTGRLANVPGASDILKCGFITYSEKAKRKYVGVKRRTLDKFSAVSGETAMEMSKGAAAAAKTDCAIAITGIAGPDGGSDKHPVGQVFIGVTVQKKTFVKEYYFSGDRQDIRSQAVTEALALLRLALLKHFSEITFK